MRRRWIGGALLATVALFAAASGIALVTGRTAGAEQAATVETFEVRRAPLVRRIDAHGELRSSDSVTIGAPAIPRFWNFTVTAIAEEGIEVAPGTPLVSFDAQRLVERRDERVAQLDTARKELEKATLEQQEKLGRFRLELAEIRARRKRLARQLDIPSDLRSRLEVEKLRVDAELAAQEEDLAGRLVAMQEETLARRIEASTSRVRELEAEVEQLGEHIARTTVRAPRAGYVVHVADWNGDKMKVGQSMWHGRQVIDLADLARMEVAAEIAEPDAGHVRVGQRVEVRVDAAPDRLFEGRIESLGRLFHPRSQEDPSMVFDAVVALDEPAPDLMRPGMAARVVVLASSPEPVLQVPEAAVVHGARGPEVTLRGPDGGSRRVPVALGPRWRGVVVVTSGLREGDTLEVPRGS